MNPKRPGAVTLICVLTMLASLVDCMTALKNLWDTGDPELTAWVQANPRSATLQIALIYTHAAITLFACYFMLRAKNWARWLFVLWLGARHVASFVLLAVPADPQGFDFLRFRGASVPGLLFFFVALIILFRPGANEYFAVGDRPWWKVENDE